MAAKAGTTGTSRTARTTSASKKPAAKSSSRTATTASKKTTATSKPRTPRTPAPQPTALEKAQAAAKAGIAELEAVLTKLDNADAAANKAQAKRDAERQETLEALRQYPKRLRSAVASKRPSRSGRVAANAAGAARQALGADRNWFVIGAVLLGILLGFGLAGLLIWANTAWFPQAWGLIFVWFIGAPLFGGLFGHHLATKNR